MTEPVSDENIDNVVTLVQRAEVYARLENCTVAEAVRRMLKFMATISKVDAELADGKQTLSMDHPKLH